MSAPKRIQIQRAKGWRKPVGAIVVARPRRFGNPFVVTAAETPASVVDKYERALLSGRLKSPSGAVSITVADVKRELHGKDLACWCSLDDSCHADVLLRIANAGST